jgi:hypothetical protein
MGLGDDAEKLVQLPGSGYWVTLELLRTICSRRPLLRGEIFCAAIETNI